MPCDALFHRNVNGILVVLILVFLPMLLLSLLLLLLFLFCLHVVVGSLGSGLPKDPILSGTVVPTFQLHLILFLFFSVLFYPTCTECTLEKTND